MSTPKGLQSYYKTQNLVYRISYRNHKKKLNEIKHNNHTSMQFYNSGIKRPEDRKKMMLMKMRKQEIQIENEKLKHKIDKIREGKEVSRRQISESADYRGRAHRRQQAKRRYMQQQDSDKIQLNSEYGNGESIKCFIPPVKQRAKYLSQSYEKRKHMSMLGGDLQRRQDLQMKGKNPQTGQQNGQKSQQKPSNTFEYKKQQAQTINRKLNTLIKQTKEPTHEQLYFEPQKQSHRVVVYKRTKIPAPFYSFLIEISLISKRLLITAYGMGLATQNFKIMLDKKKSKEVLQDCDKNYQRLWEKINIDPNGLKINGHSQNMEKFMDKNDGNENIQEQQQNLQEGVSQNYVKNIEQNNKQSKQAKAKSKKYQIQQDFLNRNYYKIVADLKQKRQQQIKKAEQKNKPNNQNTINSDQALSKSRQKPRESLLRAKLQKFRQQHTNDPVEQKQELSKPKQGQKSRANGNIGSGLKFKQKKQQRNSSKDNIKNVLKKTNVKNNTAPAKNRLTNSLTDSAKYRNQMKEQGIDIKQTQSKLTKMKQTRNLKKQNEITSINQSDLQAVQSEEQKVSDQKYQQQVFQEPIDYQNKSEMKNQSDLIDQYSQGEFNQSSMKNESYLNGRESLKMAKKRSSKNKSNLNNNSDIDYAQQFEQQIGEQGKSKEFDGQEVYEEDFNDNNSGIYSNKAVKQAHPQKNQLVQCQQEYLEEDFQAN